MNEEQNIWKSIGLSLLISNAPELAISFLIAMVNEYNKVEIFFISLIYIYGVYFIIWLKRFVWTAIISSVNKKKVISAIAEDFAANELPKPHEYVDDPEDYFLEIKSDESLPIKPRLYASMIIGVMANQISTLRYFESFQYRRLLRRSMQRYAGSYSKHEI